MTLFLPACLFVRFFWLFHRIVQLSITYLYFLPFFFLPFFDPMVYTIVCSPNAPWCLNDVLVFILCIEKIKNREEKESTTHLALTSSPPPSLPQRTIKKEKNKVKVTQVHAAHTHQGPNSLILILILVLILDFSSRLAFFFFSQLTTDLDKQYIYIYIYSRQKKLVPMVSAQ